MKACATKRAADGKPGVWSLPTRSLSIVFGMWIAAQRIAGLARLLADDAHRVRRVVAADVEEVADAVRLQHLEDLLAVGQVGLVAGRAERRGGRGGHQLEVVAVSCVRSTKSSSTMPRTPWRAP